MIKLIEYGLKSGLDIPEINNPSSRGVYFTPDMQLNSKRMPVKTPALVSRGGVRKPMGRLEGEFFEYQHHGPDMATARSGRSRS